MMADFDIVAINVEAAEAFCDDGTLLPITTWLDTDGEECVSDFARVAVAGPHPIADKPWAAFDLADFGDASRH